MGLFQKITAGLLIVIILMLGGIFYQLYNMRSPNLTYIERTLDNIDNRMIKQAR